MADANISGTVLNVLSTVVVAIVLAVLNRIYKVVSNLLVTSKTNSRAIRAIIGYILDRDGVRIHTRLGDEPIDPDSSD